jgi:hypothetical protein
MLWKRRRRRRRALFCRRAALVAAISETCNWHAFGKLAVSFNHSKSVRIPINKSYIIATVSATSSYHHSITNTDCEYPPRSPAHHFDAADLLGVIARDRAGVMASDSGKRLWPGARGLPPQSGVSVAGMPATSGPLAALTADGVKPGV